MGTVSRPGRGRPRAAGQRARATPAGLELAVFDSDARDLSDATLRLANGRRVADREIAPEFPSTFITDARGIVLFAHRGPVADWPGLVPLLRHAAAGVVKP